ncbi:capsule biosynthesis protein [Palleronia caenipelagi]|uniref:Capsular biosynthesis protein n=1 Tax=Palleronia caenipelagi TaxID=2489174 RepID=A0A547Q5F9_9RHOB|nr:capsular biosynthesis protein [Palleronia caenipelagi]TRD21587.1 capsular biosynthesis protein [Palleronia caenipelagi]
MNQSKRFLFLQGPHGPFFDRLAALLRAAGMVCWRVGFNRGDEAFWSDADHYIPYTDTPEHWRDFCMDLLDRHQITDIVLYGDTRRIHAEAVELARSRGLTVHVFEEGYLRPYWVTYERGGSNGNSRLMDMSVADMQAAIRVAETDLPVAPSHWGDLREHVFYGALYHAYVMLANRHYAGFRPHREITVAQEFRVYLRRLLLSPAILIDRRQATRRIANSDNPYHLVLLQLEHDSNFIAHSSFENGEEFVRTVIDGFAAGAPRHHHLVFKAHPLEDGRFDQRRAIRRIAAEMGILDRVHYVRGGKLAKLLDNARSAVTVNSTAAQQVLWRGLPVKTFGAAVYTKPEFVSTQDLPDFFAEPVRPQTKAYRDYRRYLLETSQIPGSFYSAKGRRQLLRQVADMVLAPHDPYDSLLAGTAAPRQQVSSQ